MPLSAAIRSATERTRARWTSRSISPAADLVGIWEDATLYPGGRRFPEVYIGGTPSEFPDRYEAASPFRLLRPGLPRTLIVSGETDRLVHLARVRSVAERIAADSGTAPEFLVAPFADHGFDGELNSFGAQLVEALVTRFVYEATRLAAAPSGGA